VDFYFGDVQEHEKLKPHLDWADVVIWLAARVGDGACRLNPEAAKAINQDSVVWMARNYDRRILFISTCSVYGAQDSILDEHSPTNPLSIYAATKLAAEQALIDRNAMIFRLGTLYGVSDNFSRLRLDLVVNTMTMQAHRLGKISVFGGEQYRPLIHVKDAAQALVDNISTQHTGIYNLHSENMKITDLAAAIRDHFPTLTVEQIPMKVEDIRNYRVSSRKAEETWGFKPKRTLDEGIEEVKVLLVSNRIKDMDNPRFVNHQFLAMAGDTLEVA
jgi:nucleoside-diphosphate-sugar epimerase